MLYCGIAGASNRARAKDLKDQTMLDQTLQFCGRADEMHLLVNRWRLVSHVATPSPQVVVIKSERGVGKTRLALEFYRQLSLGIDNPGATGYWPDVAAALQRNLDVNPDLDDCRYNIPIPFLWWGIRAGDPGAENAVAGDAIATYDRHLAPHLVPMLIRSRMAEHGWDFAKACTSIGLDFTLGAIPVVGTVFSVAKAFF